MQLARAEDLGTGIRNIYQYLKPYAGTVPVFRDEDSFIVDVPLIGKTVGKTEELIIEIIKENSKITIPMLQEQLKLSRRGIEWQIKRLKEKGILERIGPTKGGYWKIKV